MLSDAFSVNNGVHIACLLAYAALSLYFFVGTRRRPFILATCCAGLAVWSGASATPSLTDTKSLALIDLGRMMLWYFYLLSLYRRSGVAPRWHFLAFSAAGILGLALGTGSISLANAESALTLLSLPIATRLSIAVGELLLAENVFTNIPKTARWHFAIPCIVVGGSACFDILVIADQILSRSSSPTLSTSRALMMLVIAPCLILAGERDQRWIRPLELRRTTVFHSATLILSGCILLALVAVGEVFRHLSNDVGRIAEIALLFSGLIGLATAIASRSTRSALQRSFLDHFLPTRYDYRLQWLQCIATLSGSADEIVGKTPLSTRAIKAIADIVDSPNGSLFLSERTGENLSWAGSWNLPPSPALDNANTLIARAATGDRVINVREHVISSKRQNSAALSSGWLAVPLMRRETVFGMVVVGPSRADFDVDPEVEQLIHIVGREVALQLAEQKAEEEILSRRDLHDYAKRFSFVAHDIKNVASQLSLLVANSKIHLQNPEFQMSMVDTVQASVEKINRLIGRLNEPGRDQPMRAMSPVAQITDIVAEVNHAGRGSVGFDYDQVGSEVRMNPEDFRSVMIHLLNNAIDAGSPEPVRVTVHHHLANVQIEVADRGSGMSPQFIRDQLFTPLRSAKIGGSGIGAFQARELLRDVGGQLTAISEVGVGTIMRIILPCVARPPANHGAELASEPGDPR